MDQLNFIPFDQELSQASRSEAEIPPNEEREMSVANRDPNFRTSEPPHDDLEFLVTPLNLLADDNSSPPPGEWEGGGVTRTQAQSPRTRPAFPGRSTTTGMKTMNFMNLEPERSLEWDNLRQIKHADPYGRVTLGRKFSFRTFIVEALADGAFLLRPAVIMEQRQFEKKLGSTTFLRCPTMR